MVRQSINIGITPNDGTGDTLRSTGSKVNANFIELYNGTYAVGSANKVFATPNGANGLPSFRSLVNADLPNSGVGSSYTSLTGSNYKGTGSSILTPTINTKGVITTNSFVDVFIRNLKKQGKVNYSSTSTITVLPTTAMCVGSTGSNYKIFNTGSAKVVNISTTGANGLDAGSPSAKNDYHLYMIGKVVGSTGSVTTNFLLSANDISYGEAAPTLPSGYTYYTQLPVSLWVNASTQIEPFIHNPNANSFYYTEFGSGSLFRIFDSYSGTSFASSGSDTFIPSTSRLADLNIISSNDADANTRYAYIKPKGASTTIGMQCSKVHSDVSRHDSMCAIVPTGSTQQYEMKVSDADVDVWTYVRGYIITEVN